MEWDSITHVKNYASKTLLKALLITPVLYTVCVSQFNSGSLSHFNSRSSLKILELSIPPP